MTEKGKTKNIVEKVKENIKYHLVDSTAILAESAPVFAAFETQLAGLSDEISMNARMLVAGLTYFAGMGYLFGKGRDLSRKVFKVKDETKEKIKLIHDGLYTGAFNLIGAPLIYLASGAKDLTEIALGTAVSVGIGSLNGPLAGYSIDAFRDLTGLEECNRTSYPNFIKKQSSKIKKGLAALLVAGSLSLIAGNYALTTDEQPEIPEEQNIASVQTYSNLENKFLDTSQNEN